MAAPNLTSGERMDVYRLMFMINRSFHRVVQQLEEMGKAQLLNSRDTREMVGLTQELQLEINTLVLDPLESMKTTIGHSSVKSALRKKRDSVETM